MASLSARTTTSLLVAMITAALIAPAPPTAEAAVQCTSVLNTLSPCLNFVLFGGSVPPAECCNGVRSVFNAAATKEDRQAVCTCLKSLVESATPGMIKNAAEIPGKCGVPISFVISPSIDCSKVN
ncbi:non-specific lipid-transfer protein 1-like [Henckelia pumila]|uniref:non-specific lipid-transfer protein 1-like n=1 Tax=Henckelia pumila TaxID=405737 RepID=UPI003C6E27DC